MRREERIIAELITAVLAEAEMHFNQDQSNGEPDFRLVVGGEEFPFEVTRATNAKVQGIYAAIGGRGPDGEFVPRVVAQHDWLVVPGRDANIKRVRERVDGLLGAIEREGRTQFIVGAHAGSSPAVRRIWDEIRVEAGTHMPWNPPGRIGISPPSDGGTLSGDHVLDAVEREAQKSDNRRKLTSSTARERHLAVYLDDLGYLAQASMRRGLIPTRAPNLPAEITHIWVATNEGLAPDYLLWSYDAVAGWKDRGRFERSDESDQRPPNG